MKGKHPLAPRMATPDMIRCPLRDFIAELAQLPMTQSGEPDYAEAEPDVLVSLAESAELAAQILYDGLASLGLLYSWSDVTRKDVIEKFIAEVKLTKAGASTYYQMIKDKHEPTGKK